MAKLIHLSDLHLVSPGTLTSRVLDTNAILEETINEIAKMDCKYIQRQTHDICVYNKSVLDSYQWKKKFNDIKV